MARKDSLLALPDTVVALLEDARAVVNDEATRALPGEIRDAVVDLRATVRDFNDSEAIAKLVLALEKADSIATNLAQASESVPELVEELRAVAQKANALRAEDLIAAATQMLDSAEQVIGTEAARALPASLNAALDQVRGALDDLRTGGAVENANATMASARDAADALAEAAAGLPDLSARLDRLAAQAETLLSAYGARSDFNKETLSALREVRDAARAVSQLARALERDPGLLLSGR